MAAKPPKPPGNLLKSNNTTNGNPYQNQNQINNNCSNNDNSLDINAINVLNDAKLTKITCNCTNINIMHLFHEMKQEFPTLPDSIVTQCVNENCHQRENCIQMLKKELDLNPTPASSFPAKVLQQQQQQARSQRPSTPLKPSRPAPMQPPIAAGSFSTVAPANKLQNFKQNNIGIDNANTENSSLKSSLSNVIGNSGDRMHDNTNNVTSNITRPRPTTLNLYGTPGNSTNTQTQKQKQLNIQLQQRIQQRQLQQQQQNLTTASHAILNKPLRKAPLPPLPPKPQAQLHGVYSSGIGSAAVISLTQQNHFNTTNDINLNSASTSSLTSPLSSSESEISLNVSLSSPTGASQQQQQQQQIQFQNQPQLKSPIRHRSVITLQPEPPYTRDFLGSPTVTSTNNSPCNNTPTSQKSFTTVNLTLRQPNANIAGPQSTIDITTGPTTSGCSGGLTYSSSSYDPRRGYQKNFHITVTDEGGIFSQSRIRPRNINGKNASACAPPTTSSGDGEGGAPSQVNGNETKIVTDDALTGVVSVNPYGVITNAQQFMQQQRQLRQQQQQQAPEIFPYATQAQNHIVASNYNNSNQLQSGNNSKSDSGVCVVVSAHQEVFKMCLPRELEVCEEIIERQKARRDKLASALRDNKKRLSHLEQEINILTDPLPIGESERLDVDIQRLRCDIEHMLNELENARRCDVNPSGSNINARQRHQQQQQQQQPQPFPRQRQQRVSSMSRLPLTSTPSQTPTPTASAISPTIQIQQQQTPNLDFIQHHSTTPSSSVLPNFSVNQQPPTYQEYYQQFQRQQQLQQQQQHLLYQHQQQYLQQQQQQRQTNRQHMLPHQQTSTNTDEEEYYTDSDIVDDDEDVEPIDMWSCNMCTFRNHPQLNICEACDNVRILPGIISIVHRDNSNCNNIARAINNARSDNLHTPVTNHANLSSSSSIETTPIATATNLEGDANLAQQQQQQFAVHT